MSDVFGGRRDRAVGSLEAAGLDALLVAPGPDLEYLAGYAAPPLERLTLLVLSRRRNPVLVVPLLERPAALATPARDLEVVGWTDGEDPYALVRSLTGQGRHAVTDRTWGSHVLALGRAGLGDLVAAGEALPLLRAVKDPEELAALRAAGRGADAAFAAIATGRFAGRRERDVADDLARLLLGNGHERVDFTIVGSGPNAASPHHEPSDRTIVAGDAVVLDFGGVAGGYCSDITRTVFVGEPTAEQRRVHDVVRAAQQAAFEAVAPGVEAQAVDRAARAVIEDAGYGERFIHRTGHGIGREVHEPPYIIEGNATPLEVGMTFSDEPGIYLPGDFGVRIEDQLAVTATGAERLNDATRELLVVD
ncbi:MAG: aminopeptidase P family protein [Actinomycetota bacterium]